MGICIRSEDRGGVEISGSVQSAVNSYFNYYRGSRSGSSSEGTRARCGPCTQDVNVAEATAHREAAAHSCCAE